EYGFEIERRVHRLGHLAKRPQFADRAAKFICAVTKGIQQSNVVDRDGCLISEGLDQCDLLTCERSDPLQVINCHGAKQVIAFEDRHPENCPDRFHILRAVRIFWVSQNIGNMYRSSFKRSTGCSAVSAGTKRILGYKILERLRGIERHRHSQELAIEAPNERSIGSTQPD